jgi:hypothetical protein
MSARNRRPLDERVANAVRALITDQRSVCPIDILMAIGWLDPGAVKRWRTCQIEFVEDALQVSPARLRQALELIRDQAAAAGLHGSETDHVSATPDRRQLHFSRDATRDEIYRRTWVSPELSGKQRDQLIEKASRAPDLVVIQPLNERWTCHRCGGTGGLLMMEQAGPACLRCVGLDDLEFLTSGDATLTRRARAASARSAVVVRFSRARKRYERQGLLVEPAALENARRTLSKLVPPSTITSPARGRGRGA